MAMSRTAGFIVAAVFDESFAERHSLLAVRMNL
jgi:hypothetical protein